MSIISHRQTGQVVIGGHSDRDDRYIAPTVITGVRFHDTSLMTDEIFGPILSVITYNDNEEPMGLISKQ